jgi:hypothetical protein
MTDQKCFVCKQAITEEAIMTGDESYHAHCFTCRTCKRRIEELVFAKTSQGIYCMVRIQQIIIVELDLMSRRVITSVWLAVDGMRKPNGKEQLGKKGKPERGEQNKQNNQSSQR